MGLHEEAILVRRRSGRRDDTVYHDAIHRITRQWISSSGATRLARAPRIASGRVGDISPSGRKGKGKRGKGRQPLTAEALTAAAIAIADADGLEAVSIRRIAADLEARPMSLYNHFDSKDDLLAAMADEVSREILVEPPLPEDWREAVRAISMRLYAAMITHPWLVVLFGRQPTFGPNAMKLAKQMAEAVSTLPLEQAEVWTMLGTVNDYVLGHTLRAVAIVKPEATDDVIPESELSKSPELASLPRWLRSRAEVERFEAGLEVVLDGIERRVLADG
jgi:AcrR family transcriptional regulator